MAERVWKATPRQREFLKATEDEVLYGGAAGGGKTDSLLILSAKRCTEASGAHVLFLRRAYPDLEMTAIKRSLELFTGTGPKYDAGKHRWRWPNGSVLQFGYLERDKDCFRYQSAEFDLICFDELTQFSEFQYRYLLSRNRTTKRVKAYMRAATNPGGIGHAWVRARFVDVAAPGQLYSDPATGRTRRFIPAKVVDNPYLIEADPGYLNRLAELPEAQRTALLEGSWDVVEGAAFPEWRHDLHTCDPQPLPPGWLRFRAMDWGYAKPFWIGWFAIDYDGRLWLYREWYGCKPGQPDTGVQMTAAEVAHGILERESEKEVIAYNVADPSIWQQTGHSGPSIGEEFLREGVGWQKADNDRIQGWLQVHQRLRPLGKEQPPGLIVFNNCLGLIRTLPVVQIDPNNPEDVDTNCEDHPMDGLRYACMSRPMAPIGPEPPKTMLQKMIEQALASRKPELEGWYR